VSLLCYGTPTPEAGRALAFLSALHSEPAPRFPRPIGEHLRHLADPYPTTVCYPAEPLRARLRRIVAEERPDLVQFEFLGIAHLMWSVPPGPRRVLVHHCLTSELRARQVQRMPWGPRRAYYAMDLPRLTRFERAVLRSVDGCVAVSDRDAARLRARVPGLTVATVPNGVDTQYFRPAAGEDPRSLLFIGSFGHDEANVDGVRYMAHELLPRIRAQVPDVRLTIVGGGAPPAVQALGREPGIEVLGRVDDVRPHLARAAVLVLPLRAGAGTKVRIFTAMAMSKAVLATPLGAEGWDGAPGGELVVADGPEAFAREAVALLRDPARRTRLGAAARARVVREYDWRVLGRRLEAFHAALLDGAGAGGRTGVCAGSAAT
jgi:glycosyltransferase involved in cell wall biosynthesis